jgi:hypothetical protein
MAVDGVADLCSGRNTAIVPGRDNALPPQAGEMLFKLIAQTLVGVGV